MHNEYINNNIEQFIYFLGFEVCSVTNVLFIVAIITTIIIISIIINYLFISTIVTFLIFF